jgi:NADH-quinone oxidoreductase subunit C
MEKAETKNNQTKLLEVKEETSNLLSNSLINSISTTFGEQVKLVYKKENRSKIMVSPENLVETALFFEK